VVESDKSKSVLKLLVQKIWTSKKCYIRAPR